MNQIEFKTNIVVDEYTQYVCEAFDIQNVEQTTTVIPFDLGEVNNFEWNIGLIIGNSGCGKTSILNKLGVVKSVNFDSNKSLISNFHWLEPKEATLLLTSVGLSSVPTWLKPYNTLSNGEQYRAVLAYLVSSAKDGETILIDEYTSVVNRDVAKIMSYSLQKYIRKSNKKIILASCHYDILEWLMPDWIYSPEKKEGALERCDYLRQGRPQIELQVTRTESDTWNWFKKHHYLTEERNKGFYHLVFEWNSKPIGIVIYKNYPSGSVKNGFSLSRTVVLPDYQGIGIGSKISEFVCAILKNNGGRIFTKTINPALGEHRNNSNLWRKTSKNGKYRSDMKRDNVKFKNRLKRISYCHEYIGESISGYDNLLLPINKMREIKVYK